MKRIVMLAALMLMMPAAAHAQSVSEKIFFGKDKGKDILTSQDLVNQKMDQQNALLQALLDELKKTNQLLAQQVDGGQKQTLALLKGFDVIMKKYNKELPAGQ